MVKTALAGAVSAAGLSELLRHAEAYTTVANRLKLVTTNATEFTAAQRAVFDIAQRSGQPLTTTAELYQRIATNQKELKLSGQGVAGIVETIAKTMVISGSSTESANAALIQLGQAFASGVLRGEELNSVMEQAPALAQAIAKGMGVSVGALRSLGAAGMLTADSVVKALQNQASAVNEQFGRMQNTVSTGMTRLDNSATNLIGKFDQATSTSSRLSDMLTSMAKSLDSVSANGDSFSETVARVTNVVETLAVVVGARLAVAVGQSAVSFVSATKASLEQTAALVRSVVAANAATVAEAASAKQTMLTAASRQADAKALLERANVELATAEQKVAADRMRQASEVGNLQAVQSALVAERALEEQRLRAQITETGRAQSVARLAELRLSEVAIINQVKVAEVALAETTVATSAEIQAAYKVRAAAAAGYAETTLAANEAIALSDKATAAATATSRSVAAVSSAGGGLMGLLTGPVGLIATAGLVALSFFNFGKGTDAATQALIDQHATVDESIKKFEELGAATQRVQRLTWIDEQKEALKEASSALDDYTYKVERGIAFRDDGADKFRAMINEVKSGQRDLSSVTSWLESTIKLYPESEKELAKLTQTYDNSTTRAGELAKVLKGVTTESGNTAKAATTLATAQQTSAGQSAANVAAWDKYYSQLIKTRDLLGANTEAEAAYTAARMGATPAQIAAAKLIGEQTDTLKAYQEAIKQSNEVEKAALRIKLASLYAAEDAQNDAAAAQKKALEDTAKAAEASAGRQVTAMQQVIDQTLRAVQGQNLLLVQPQKQNNLSGAALLTFGGATPAAPVVPKATPIERANAATAQLDATTEANKRVDKAANAAAAALKAQAKALQDLLDKSGISTKAANDMADAYLGGADNVRAMTIQQKIEEELLKTGAGARDRVTKAINDMQDAEDRRDVAKTAAAMKVEVEQTLAQAKATLQGSDALEIYNVNKSMQVELAGKNIQYGSKEYDQLLKQTKAQLEANKALEAANKANDLVDRLNPQIKLLKEYTEDQKALNDAISMYPEKADLYRESLVKLGQEYGDNQAKLTVWGRLTEGAIDRIDKSFADAWLNIDKGFKGFSEGLMDGFKQLLAEMAHEAITKPIIISFANALLGTNKSGGISDTLGNLFGDGSSGGSSGGTSGIIGTVKNLYSAYSAITGVGQAAASGYAAGGVSGAASGVASYYGGLVTTAASTLSSVGATLVGAITGNTAAIGAMQAGYTGSAYAAWVAGQAGTAGAAAAGGGATAGASGALGSAASMWPLAVVMGMIQSGKLYSAGVRPDAGEMYDSAGGTGLGKVVMSIPTLTAKAFEIVDGALSKIVGGKAAAILTGSTLYQAVWSKVGSKLFGGSYQTKDTGIQLGVTGGEFDADQYVKQKKKGGLISGSSKTRYLYSDLPDDTQDALGSQYNATAMGAMALFTQLGVKLNDSVLDGLTMASSQISTQGKTSEQIQAEVDHWFALLGDQVVVAVSKATDAGLSGFSYVGLQAFVKNLYDVNAVLKHVNVGVYDMTVSGGFMAEQLSAWAGGIDALKTSVAAYYDAFFTDTQKSIDSLQDVKDTFASVDQVLPDSREGFKNMVEGIDKSTESGRQLFLTLVGLSQAADAAYDIIEARQKTYYGAFYSESENTARSVADITAEFKKANVALPANRDGYRAIVDGIDRTTKSGDTLYNTMMALAGSADTFYKAQEQAQSAAQAAAIAGASNAMSALQRAVTAEKNSLTAAYNARVASLNDMLSTAQASVTGLTNTGTALETALKSLNGTSETTVKMLREQAKATLQNALATAQGGGSLAGFDGLDDALTSVSTNTTDMYGSLEDFTREQGRTANVVAQLNAINGVQLTTEQQLLKSIQGQISDAKIQYDAQMEILDAQLDTAQKQLDALNGVDNSVLSVADALKAFNASVQAAIAAAAAAAKPVASTGGSYTGGTGSAGAPSYNDINAIYNSVLGRDADAAGAVYWGGQAGSMTAAQLAAAIKADAVANGEIKGFASGGFHSGGLRLVGEDGPELEVTGPSRIYNASQTAAMLNGGDDNAALLAEIRELRAENQRGQFQIAKYSQKVAQLLEKFDNEGMPQERDYA
jgi:tape measure domain-containing protein